MNVFHRDAEDLCSKKKKNLIQMLAVDVVNCVDLAMLAVDVINCASTVLFATDVILRQHRAVCNR